MIASCSFASMADVTQWSNYLTQQAESLTRRSSLPPQQAKNTVNNLSVVSVVPKSLSTGNPKTLMPGPTDPVYGPVHGLPLRTPLWTTRQLK